jgi:hypothetical protein
VAVEVVPVLAEQLAPEVLAAVELAAELGLQVLQEPEVVVVAMGQVQVLQVLADPV